MKDRRSDYDRRRFSLKIPV